MVEEGPGHLAGASLNAEQDTRVNAGMAPLEEQLKKAGVPYRLNVYPGVDHAFHNDTSARYNVEQSRRAWTATIEWFRRYLV